MHMYLAEKAFSRSRVWPSKSRYAEVMRPESFVALDCIVRPVMGFLDGSANADSIPLTKSYLIPLTGNSYS